MSKPHLATYAGGFPVLQIPREGTEAVTAQFFFDVGARHERPDENGLAHFTEHMVFKGGKTYQTAQAVADAVNKVGGYTNAYTSHEVTSFYVKSAAERVSVGLDVMSDYLARPNFDATELEKERGVIIEEINRANDDPSDQLAELMGRTRHGDHPLGRDVLGTKERIKAMPRDYFVEWTNRFYTPQNGILALTGNLSAVTDELLNEITSRFTATGKGSPEPAKPHQGSRVAVLKKDIEQTHVGITVSAPHYGDREAVAILDVLSMILGGNMSSRLFHRIREQQGLCYTVFSMPDLQIDDGVLYIYAGVPNDKADHALAAIYAELHRMASGDLTAEELQIGKESLKGNRALRLEDSTSLGTYYAMQQLKLGEYETPQTMAERVDAVTAEQIISLAKKLFVDDGLSVGVVGPQQQATFERYATLG